MGIVVVALSLELDQVVRMIALDRGGIVDEYLSVPEFYGPLPPGDVIGLAANPTVLARLTGPTPGPCALPLRRRPSRASCRRRASILAGLAAVLGIEGRRLRTREPLMLTLYDAARCPFCARVRIVLEEKDVPFEAVPIDLGARPAWLYEKNPSGKVPVLEEDGWLLAESAVIDEYLDERYPDPPLLPADPGESAFARLLVFRFDDYLGARTTPCVAARTAPTSGSPKALAPRRPGRIDAVPRWPLVRARRRRLRPLGAAPA